MKISRRDLLSAALGATAITTLPALLRAQGTGPAQASLTIHPDQKMGKIPENYTGLSYESSQLADPNFFSPANSQLIGLARRLGHRGVLRIGGNSSEFAAWQPADTTSPAGDDVGAPDTGKAHRHTVTTPDAIDNLAGFLDTTGWQLIFGVNLGNGIPEMAADEAAYVWQHARRHVQAFQIGNEPDLYNRNGLRPSAYAFPDYFAEWQRFADAITKRIPDAPLAGPDIAYKTDWVAGFAKAAGHRARFLSGHYYAEGPPTNPAMNIDRLLKPNPNLLRSMASFMDTSRESHLPYRMTEGNSCYNGGKQGVSDTFASALWGGDYMLQTAVAGYAGVNFHGGGRGWYTPIATDHGASSARPLYYGMLLAGFFAGATFVGMDFNVQGANTTAYAAHAGDHLLAALFNKDETAPVRVSIDAGPIRSASCWRLTAPAVDSTEGVTFGGAAVTGNGDWHPSPQETLDIDSGQPIIDLPPATAALVFIH